MVLSDNNVTIRIKSKTRIKVKIDRGILTFSESLTTGARTNAKNKLIPIGTTREERSQLRT